MTPPMLPRSPTPKPFEPSSETGHVNLLSEHSTPVRNELQDLDAKVLKADRILRNRKGDRTDVLSSDIDSSVLGEIYSPLRGLKGSPQLPSCRRRLSDLKVDGPLTPQSCNPPLRIGDIAKEALEQLVLTSKPIPGPVDSTSSDDMRHFINDILQPISKEVNCRIEQEQLIEADTIHRVQIPVMDFDKPLPPWKAWKTDIQELERKKDDFLQDLKANLNNAPSWTIPRTLERKLKWAPFPPGLARVAVEECIEEQSLADSWLAEPESPNQDILVWKREGLQFLADSEEVEETMEEAVFPESADFASVMRKRKLNLEDVSLEDMEREANYKKNTVKPPEVLQNLCLPGDAFSASHSLTKLLGFRSAQFESVKAIRTYSSFFPNQNQPVRGDELNHKVHAVAEAGQVEPEREPFQQLSMPTPAIELPATPSPFVISSTLLTKRKLARQISSYYPTAIFIERDFSAHSPTPLPWTYEADLLLSPSTGLILTTLSHLHQRPPPAQPLSTLRTRILYTAPRYSTVLVLVSQNHPSGPPPPISNADAAAITSLTAFTHLPTFIDEDISIQLVFVPGGEDELVRSIVGMMVKHGVDGASTELLQEETTWELWLRRAGLNAFGAQAVLAELRAPTGSHVDETSAIDTAMVIHGNVQHHGVRGLPEFVKMGQKERLRRFSGIFKGEGLLKRIGTVIDKR